MKGAVILSIHFGLGHPAVWCSLSLIKKAQIGHIQLRAPTRISQSCTRALALSRSSDIRPTGVLMFPWVNSAHLIRKEFQRQNGQHVHHPIPIGLLSYLSVLSSMHVFCLDSRSQ